MDINACATQSMETGTGFLVAPDLVATVAHVVQDAGGTVRVTSPTSGLATLGSVIGLDLQNDLALVRTDIPLPGHVFTLAEREPPIGTEMAAIGFPLAQAMQLSIGHITGTHDHRLVSDEFDLSDVLLSDSALNPGNSGGPWITRSGTVIALDESGPPYSAQTQSYAQGNNGGVSATIARSDLASWRKVSSPATGSDCEATGPATAAIDTLNLYFYAIDNSDYATAYAQLAPDKYPISGLANFIKGMASSTDAAGDGSWYFSLVGTGQVGGHVFVDVEFQSHQHAEQGRHGETCTDWYLRYVFQDYAGLQLILDAPAIPGTPGDRPC